MARDPDGGLELAIGIGVVVLIFAKVEVGVWVAIAAIVGWFFYWVNKQEKEKVEFERNRAEQAQRERLERACKHGTRGAHHNPSLCGLCTVERLERDAGALDEARRIEAERLAQQALWRENIRTVDYLRQVDPTEFEQIVIMLHRAMGFDVQETPRGGDGGVDGYLRKNGNLTILQCKRVQASVGQPIVRDLYGVMNHKSTILNATGSISGLLVTTGRVSRQAREWISAGNKPISIVEADELVQLIRQHLNSTTIVPPTFAPTVIAPPISKPLPRTLSARGVCPRCGKALRRIRGRTGVFYGCTGYPDCRHTQSSLA